jgi:FG-GAP repeat/Prealbumin-like fold domain
VVRERPLGLEQGFTLKARPAGARTGQLTFALSLTGNVTPSVERSSHSLTFAGSNLRYTGLTAFDARGRRLPAQLELHEHTLLIRVGDEGARYPLRIDPFVQNGKLTASDGGAYDNFGASVAISGDTIVAGALDAEAGGRQDVGAAYVFVKPASGWANATERAKLTSAHPRPGGFGSTVAISGDTIVVGAQAETASTPEQGVVYVFVKPAGGWTSGTQTAKLTASDGASGDFFGDSVAISGDTLVAGAPQKNVSGHDQQGAAYVFVKPPAGWTTGTERAKLTASEGVAYDDLSGSVATSGDTIVAGAIVADVSGLDQGAAYVFQQVPAAITVTKHLVPASDPGRFDLKVGQKVVKAGAGEGGTGATGVVPGTYRVSESAAAGTSLSGYASSIACTINGNPGPSASGTSLNVSVDWGDVLACTLTNRMGATITLRKDLRPSSDPGRFDLKVAGTVVKAGAGNGAPARSKSGRARTG